MTNPFEEIGSFLGLGGGSGTPSSGGDTPFQPGPLTNFFDPSNNSSAFSNMMGSIGRLMGVPTQQQRQAQADAVVFQKLSAQMEANGGNPQTAIMKFLQTPEGVNLMSQPGAADSLERWTKTITPPNPTQLTTAPGQSSTYFQNGKPIGGNSVPPTETQNYQAGTPTYVNTPPGSQTTGMTKNGQSGQVYTPTSQSQTFHDLTKGLDENTLRILAINTLNPQEVQQRALAIQQLVASGQMDQATGDKFMANMYQVHQGADETGAPNNSFYLIDHSPGGKTRPLMIGGVPVDPSNPQTIIPSSVPNAPGHVIPPDGYMPDGSIDGNKLTGLKYMFLGAGMANHVISLMGNVVRTFDPFNPEQASQVAAIRHSQIDSLDTALAQLGAVGDGRTRLLAEEWKERGPGKFTDTVDAYKQAMVLRQRLEQIKVNDMQYLAPGNPFNQKTKLQKEQEIGAVNNVLSALPSMSDMQQMTKDLKVGAAPATTGATVVKSAAGLLGGAINDALGGKKVKTQSFTNPQGQPGETPQPLPSPKDIGGMGFQQIQALPKNLPQEQKDAVISRLKELGAQSKTKTAAPTTGKGNPPAPAAKTENSMMSGTPIPYSEKGATPPLEDWLRNPAGERNLIFQKPGEKIEGATYGSDGNWHKKVNDKWYTIVPAHSQKAPAGDTPL